MGKKKRGHPDVEDVLARPWCYYCERDFDDLKILISHQKAKHFKCDRCGRRLNTAGGLSVHMNQVHKEQLGAVENALPNRQGLEVEIFGMEGIPEDVTAAHNQRVLQQFYEQQAERRAATGNPTPGGATASAPKKAKFESPGDLKKRLAEHRAKKAAEAAGISSGDNTPLGSTQEAQSPATMANSPGPFPQAASPHVSQLQPYAGAPQVSLQPAFPPSYGTTAYPQPGFQPPYGTLQSFPPPQPPGFSPTAVLPYPPPGGLPFMAGQPFPPPGAQAGFPGAPLRPYGSGSPANYPAQASGAVRQNSLPSPSNLPQRPAFNAPPVNHQQLQQMHHGQVPGLPGSHAIPANGLANPNYPSALGGAPDPSTSAAIDELIASATRELPKLETPPAITAVQEKEKKSKKDKDKNARLVYSDNEVSPEEKMAQLPRYSFSPSQKGEVAMT